MSLNFTEKRGTRLESRLALIGIIVEETRAAQKVNELLHEFGSYIVGRMGIPYRNREVNVISIVIDANQNIISTLSGKLGKLEGVSVKTVYSKVGESN